jgi:acyl-CoA thioesterase
MKNLDEIKQIFAGDHFATDNGAVIECVDTGYAKCTLEITKHHQNATGNVMGGVPFMLADFAFAVAANHEQMRTVSHSSSISFLGVAKGKQLIAEARCIKEGRSTCCYRVSVCDDLQTPVAEVTVNGFHIK